MLDIWYLTLLHQSGDGVCLFQKQHPVPVGMGVGYADCNNT